MSRRNCFGSEFPRGLMIAAMVVIGLAGCGSGVDEVSIEDNADDALSVAFSLRSRDVTPPTIPANLFATAVASAQINLAWQPSTDNRRVTGYIVRRNGTLVARLGNVTTYEDAGLAAATEYSYRVRAVDAAGNVSGLSVVATATTQAADATAPLVSATSPANAETGIAVNVAITATFSEPMLTSTLNAATFKLATRNGAPVTGTISVKDNTMTFTPAADLSAGTAYDATLSTAVADTAGNTLAAVYTWTFATGAAPDTTPPIVTFTSPSNNSTGATLNTSISASFSEGMTNATLTPASFFVAPKTGGTPISGSVSVSGNTATFTPLTILNGSTPYVATVTTAARDAAGNALAGDFTWNFTTAAAPDTTAPTVSSTSPPNGAAGVPLNSSASASFSESMTNSTLNTASFTLKTASGGTTVAGTVTVSGHTATFLPASALASGTLYSATLTTAAKDAAGNPLAASFTWQFTTAAILDTTPPKVNTTSPANMATGVPANAAVSATFSEAMTNSTLTAAVFTLVNSATNVGIPGTVGIAGNTVTFTPNNPLAADTQYTAMITSAAKDAAGNSLAGNVSWKFFTAAASLPGTATLAWDAVAAPALVGYRIYYGAASGIYFQSPGQGISAGNVTSYSVTGLTRGTRFYFAATSVDASGNESAFSNEVFKDIP